MNRIKRKQSGDAFSPRSALKSSKIGYAGLSNSTIEMSVNESDGDCERTDTVLSRVLSNPSPIEPSATYLGTGMNVKTHSMVEFEKNQQRDLQDPILTNPCHWHWDQVKLWLIKKELNVFIKIFDIEEDTNQRRGIGGYELLEINVDKLYEVYDIATKGKFPIKKEDAMNNILIEKLLKEITKLQVKSNTDLMESTRKTTINDLVEMKRRMNGFVDKWDKILWIEHYDETNGRLPTPEEVSEVLDITDSVATVYIQYYDNFDKNKEKDLMELLFDFNVYNDAVIWWFIIISSLKMNPSKSMVCSVNPLFLLNLLNMKYTK